MLVSDVADWELARDADDRAFGRLFDRHSARVFRHSLRLVAVPAEADEVMASTFFELWRRRADVRLVDDSVVPWLLATATYLSRNRIRGRVRYQRVIGRLPREVAEDAAETALARLEQLEQRRRLAGALRNLSAKDAALVALTVLDEMTAVQAAEVVGISPGAARMRLSRARGRLRELLVEREPERSSTREGGVR